MALRKLRFESLEGRRVLNGSYVFHNTFQLSDNNGAVKILGGVGDTLIREEIICPLACDTRFTRINFDGEEIGGFNGIGTQDFFLDNNSEVAVFAVPSPGGLFVLSASYINDGSHAFLIQDGQVGFILPDVADNRLVLPSLPSQDEVNQILLYDISEPANIGSPEPLGVSDRLHIFPVIVGEHVLSFRLDDDSELLNVVTQSTIVNSDDMKRLAYFGIETDETIVDWNGNATMAIGPEVRVYNPSNGELLKSYEVGQGVTTKAIDANDDVLAVAISAFGNERVLIYDQSSDDPAVIRTYDSSEFDVTDLTFVDETLFITRRGIEDPSQWHADIYKPAELGIDRWWGSVGSEPFPVTWTVNVPEAGNYRFDIDIDGRNRWDLVDGSTVKVNDDLSYVIGDTLGRANIGHLGPGVHTLTIKNFQIPNFALVEEVNFQLVETTGINEEVARLEALFIADWPEEVIDDLFIGGGMNVTGVGKIPDVQTLIDTFAPTIHLSEREEYHPIDVEALLEDLKERNGDEMWADGQRGDRNDWLDLSPYADGSADDDIPSAIYTSVLPCQRFQSNCEAGNELAINYFILYARSNWADFDGANTHEGDLEGIVVFLDRENSQSPWQPKEVAYSQHTVADGESGGQVVAWHQASKEGSSVNVYSALGGHPTYPFAGSTSVFSPSKVNPGSHHLDRHSGEDALAPPVVVYMPHVEASLLPETRWVLYSGFIGNNDLGNDGNFPALNLGDMAPKGIAFQQSVPPVQFANPLGPDFVFGSRYANPWHWSRGFEIISNFDGDNITDQVEEGAPNNGDGNRDGELDSEQNNVTSLPNAENDEYVTLVTSAGQFSQVVALPPTLGQPENLELPVGQFDYRIEGLTPGQSVDVLYYLPEEENINTFYKYGPTSDNPSDHWYPFLWDDVTRTGATVLPGLLIVSYVDGGRGDDDGIVNGVVTDPGAPAYITTPSDITATVLDGLLVITGTSGDDVVHVSQINSHTFSVSGIGDTTVNGSEREVFQFVESVAAHLDDGDDTIAFEGYFGKRRLGASLLLNTGEGDDEVTFESFIGTNQVFVATEGGQDKLNIFDSSFYGSSVFDLGDNNDELFLRRSGFHGSAQISGGLGVDTIDAFMMVELNIADLDLVDFEIGEVIPQPLMAWKRFVGKNRHKSHHAFVV